MSDSGHFDETIEQSAFRSTICNMVPDGATRVLDFGCGKGEPIVEPGPMTYNCPISKRFARLCNCLLTFTIPLP